MSKAIATLLSVFMISLPGLCQEKEKWIDRPVQDWPQIALINNVQFKNGDRYIHSSFVYAGTGFLIDNKTDTLAATAKHILWIAKNKKSEAVQINEELLHWTMTPKGNHRDSAVIDKLLNEDSSERLEGPSATIVERDWIVFSVKSVSPGIYPLKPRYTAIKPGEKVFILSCSYNDSLCRVYEGTILKKQGMDILIERDMREHMGGSSGSPVIDANGFLVGILSSASVDGETNKGVSVAISTEYLFQLLNKKPGLNTPKKDYGKLILETVLKQGAKKGIELYNNLKKDPKNYYVYNLRSSDRNGLRETGEKLMEMKRLSDAVQILEFNVKMNSSYYLNYNLLAKAYLQWGNKKEAIRNFRLSTKKFDDKKENEAFRELERLQRE
jgi:hypothetical protein